MVLRSLTYINTLLKKPILSGKKTKEKQFVLKDAGEPIDGFILIHEDGDSAIECCVETFDFDFDQKEKTLLEGFYL